MKTRLQIFTYSILSIIFLNSCTRPSAMDRLVHRILPEYERQFVFEEMPSSGKMDFFEIGSKGGKVLLKGNNTISLASGLNWYLKYYCNASISSACASQLELPQHLPLPDSVERHETALKENLCMNYCTFGYSTAFWDWPRWEKELDMMALNGVTMPMAVVGVEVVWRNTLRRLGFSEEQILNFLVGPAYMPWLLTGNTYGLGGPMPEEWFARQKDLQTKILSRMRELGMKPVFQGFVGIVPVGLSRRFPDAEIYPQGKWVGLNRPDVLLPYTPLFAKMACIWYEEYEKLYGKSDYWGGDLFHEGGSIEGINLSKAAKAVQAAMRRANPDARWILQAWGGNPKQEMLDGLDKEHTIIVDLCAEYWTVWKDREGFGGFPWLWSHVTNYGGNIGLHGRLPSLAEGPVSGLNDPKASGGMLGIGTTAEGVEVNPVAFDLVNEMRWRSQGVDLNHWLDAYAHRRYGRQSDNLRQAWKIFGETAYGSHDGNRRPSESVFCALPSLKGKTITASAWSQCRIFYDPDKYAKGVELFLKEADQLSDKDTYRYDAVDFVRQYLSNLGKEAYYQMTDAFKAGDRISFDTWSDRFLCLLLDQDKLLSTHEKFYVGTWLDRAVSASSDCEISDYYEWNARMLIGTWSDIKTPLRDYAHREWGGMLKDYYYPRWSAYIHYLSAVLDGENVFQPDFYEEETAWVNAHGRYIFDHTGQSVDMAVEMFNKYYRQGF